MAHLPFEGGGGFLGGVLHPLLVPAHALVIMATGLLVGQQMPQRPWPAAASYGVGAICGFALIVSAVVPRYASEVLLANASVSGMVVALAWPLHKLQINALALVTGLALALDSAPPGISVQHASAMLLGTFCGAVILLSVVVEGTVLQAREWQRLGVRIVGSWIAASAMMILGLRLAR
jgi:urease accessory protein